MHRPSFHAFSLPRVLLLCLLLLCASFLVAGAAYAWNGPPGTAPNCPANTQGCSATLDQGATTQTKSGALNLTGALTAPNVTATSLCFGADCRTSWAAITGSWAINGTSIYYSGGNVGIGTATAPAHKLDIQDTVNGILRSTIRNLSNGPNAQARFQAHGDNDNDVLLAAYSSGFTPVVFGVPLANWTLLASEGANNNGLIVGTTVAKPLLLGTNGAEHVRITSSGNVGIGTVSPNQKLDVAGNVMATLYYDRENTGYYVDPNNTSVFQAVQSSIFYDRDNTNYYMDLNSWSRVNAVNADRLDSSIIYDRDNTGYYVDPNNTSVFQAVQSSIFYDRDNTNYYMDLNNSTRIGNVYADYLYSYGDVIAGGAPVCRSNGINCPAGAAGLTFGGMFEYQNSSCYVANPWSGGCSCPGWAPQAKYGGASTFQGSNMAHYYCTN